MTPTEATRAFYDLFIAGKIEEALERFVDPEAVLVNPLPEVIPFGGVFEGRQGSRPTSRRSCAGSPSSGSRSTRSSLTVSASRFSAARRAWFTAPASGTRCRGCTYSGCGTDA